jgi:DNA helicase HerA-like ATPase
VVERAFVLPPGSRIGPLTEAERAVVIDASVVKGHYEKVIDRESAYETLAARAAVQDAAAPPTSRPAGASRPTSRSLSDLLFGSTGPRGGKREGVIESAARSAARSVGSGIGRQILRGMLGMMVRR